MCKAAWVYFAIESSSVSNVLLCLIGIHCQISIRLHYDPISELTPESFGDLGNPTGLSIVAFLPGNVLTFQV